MRGIVKHLLAMLSDYGAVPVVAFGLLSADVGNTVAQRQGFIAGLGLGPGWQFGMSSMPSDTHVGLSIDFKLGSQIGRSWQVYYRQSVLRSLSEQRYPWFAGLAGIGASYSFPGTCGSATGTVGVASFFWNDDGWGNG